MTCNVHSVHVVIYHDSWSGPVMSIVSMSSWRHDCIMTAGLDLNLIILWWHVISIVPFCHVSWQLVWTCNAHSVHVVMTSWPYHDSCQLRLICWAESNCLQHTHHSFIIVLIFDYKSMKEIICVQTRAKVKSNASSGFCLIDLLTTKSVHQLKH